MPDRKPTDSLLLIGSPQGMELVVTQALSSASSARVYPGIGPAIAHGANAELVVVLQHWSDEYLPDEIQELLRAFPLSRIIVVQGPWCASDRRTRQYWPAAICVSLTQAADRLKRELDVLQGRRAPLPWTASMDEIFAFDHSETVSTPQ